MSFLNRRLIPCDIVLEVNEYILRNLLVVVLPQHGDHLSCSHHWKARADLGNSWSNGFKRVTLLCCAQDSPGCSQSFQRFEADKHIISNGEN